MVDNGNLGKLAATYLPGTAFAPRQCLYLKEASGDGEPIKCNHCVGAKNALTVTGLQTTSVRLPPYMVDNGNLGKLAATYLPGTAFAPRQCLYLKEASGDGEPIKCNHCVGAKNALAVTGLQTTSVRLPPYMVDNGNLEKLAATYLPGTAFAPRQCLYLKEVTCMGSLKM